MEKKREDGKQFDEDPSSDPYTLMRIRALDYTSGAMDPRSTDPSSDPFEKVLGSAMIRAWIQGLGSASLLCKWLDHFSFFSHYFPAIFGKRIRWHMLLMQKKGQYDLLSSQKPLLLTFLTRLRNENHEGVEKELFHQLL